MPEFLHVFSASIGKSNAIVTLPAPIASRCVSSRYQATGKPDMCCRDSHSTFIPLLLLSSLSWLDNPALMPSGPQANVTCVPSTPAPARKRRRRPNQDLQDRLSRCEELLKQYADCSVPGQQPERQAVTPTSAEPTKSGIMSEPTRMANEKDKTYSHPRLRIVEDDGSVRFMDCYVLTTVYEEVSFRHEFPLQIHGVWGPR